MVHLVLEVEVSLYSETHYLPTILVVSDKQLAFIVICRGRWATGNNRRLYFSYHNYFEIGHLQTMYRALSW